MQKRFWYGLGILLVLLAVGLWTGYSMQTRQRPVSDALEQAAQAALDGNIERGATLVRNAWTLWEKTKGLTATVSDHNAMEEIESLFAQIWLYAQGDKTVDFAAYCTRLAQLVSAIGEAHGITWQNFL